MLQRALTVSGGGSGTERTKTFSNIRLNGNVEFDLEYSYDICIVELGQLSGGVGAVYRDGTGKKVTTANYTFTFDASNNKAYIQGSDNSSNYVSFYYK